MQKMLLNNLRVEKIVYHEADTVLLDQIGLIDYLSETEIHNLNYLKSIKHTSINILDLWSKVNRLQQEQLNEEFVKEYIASDRSYRILTSHNFYCFYIRRDNWWSYHLVQEWREDFFKLKQIKGISLHKIIEKVVQILGELYRAYPEIKNAIDDEDIPLLNDKVLKKELVVELQNILIPEQKNLKIAYDHFKIFLEMPNKNHDGFYLNKQALLVFLKSTFHDKMPIQQTLDWKTKKEGRKVFRSFYDKSIKQEKNQKNKKRKYFEIMSEGFTGFNQNDYADFHK